ncbi:DsbA family protein [Halopiger djelfimassiliensis]|uniref:DsbA family protein n=1 Tax=Halopiger djelfimassiliensis TaxID=1293047 RepID=UPI000677F5A7|nr:thioredoxin domain-containing protein [Halopiger djelfimassiliensis]
MKRTRRAVLGTAAVGIGTVAGCLGDENRDDAADSDPEAPSTDTGSDGSETGSSSDDDSDADAETGTPPEAPVAGDPDAAVTVTVYEDFACPHCRTFEQEVVPQLEEAYIDPGRIRYERREFPIPVHPTWSWAMASAAREVYETEGDDAYWAFTSDIYEAQTYSYELIESVAADHGLDGTAVREAAEEETHRSTIEADKSHGESIGVEGTPTVFVDGDDLESPAFERIADAIDSALE